MKRIFIVCIVLICMISGCSDKFDVSFINNTPDAITLSILWPGDNNRQLITIGGNSTSKVSSSMYPIDAYVVNNDQNLMRDNAYAVEMIDFRCAISTQNPNVWTVKNQLSDAQLSGDERLFLAEKNNLIGRYVIPDKLTTIEITNNESIFEIELYETISPEFILTDSDGNEKTELNGYPVNLETDGNTIYII